MSLSRAVSAAFAATGLAVLAAAPGLARLRFDVSNASYFVQDDPVLVDYRELQQSFGSDEVVYVLVDVDDAFRPGTLEDLVALGEALRGLEQVQELRSPLSSKIVVDEDGTLVGRSLAAELPLDPAARAAWRARILGYPPFRSLLIDGAGTRVGFLLTLEPEAATPAGRAQVADALTEVLARPRFAHYRAAAVGTPLNATLFARLLARELRRAFLLGLALAGLCLLYLFRDPRAALAPALVVLASLVITLGCMGWLGVPLTTVTTILVTLLICVGVADAIHVTGALQASTCRGLEPPLALRRALRETWLPCLLTSLTTGIGFLALLSSEIAPVRQLGAFAALGTLAAFVATLGLVPVCLRGWRAAPPSPHAWSERILRRLQRSVRRHPARVAAASLLLLGGLGLGVVRLYAEEDFLAYLDPSEPLRRQIEFVQARMGGAVAVEVLLDTGVRDGVADADFLHRLQGFVDYARRLDPIVRAVDGPDEPLREVYHVLGGPRALPDSDAGCAELLLTWQLADPQAYARLVSPDGSRARVTLRLDVVGSRRYQPVLDDLQRELARRFPDLPRARLTGGAVLLARMKDYLLQTQGKSFLLAFLVVAPLLVLVVGDLRLGLLSLLPNLLPLLAVLGIMGWLGIAVEVSNALLATVALGIVVDDTIHVVHRYRQGRARGGSPDEALVWTFQFSGRAVVATSLVLVLAFAVYVDSALSNVRAFGGLAAVTFFTALIADLLLLPALILLWEGRWRR